MDSSSKIADPLFFSLIYLSLLSYTLFKGSEWNFVIKNYSYELKLGLLIEDNEWINKHCHV